MIGTLWNTALYQPILNIVLLLYSVFGDNLGWAIIFFTIFLRILLFPMMKSQLESSSKLKEIQPKLQKIQEKYKDNPQKFQEEQLKVYKNANYNPLGCFLSVILPYPILIAIYQVIQAFSQNKIEGVYPFVANIVGVGSDFVINQRFLIWDLSKSYLPLAKDHGYLEFWVLGYLLLAILVGVSQYLSVKVNSMPQAKKKDKNIENKESKKSSKKELDKKDDKDKKTEGMGDMMNDMGKSLSLTLPMMTVFIAMSAPAAVSIYWAVQSWALVVAQLAYYKFRKKKKDGKNKK